MKRRGWVGLAAVAAGLALWIPAAEPPRLPAPARAFAWDQDQRWRQLEDRFQRIRDRGCAPDTVPGALARAREAVDALAKGPSDLDHLEDVEAPFFEAAAVAAACEQGASELGRLRLQLRRAVMDGQPDISRRPTAEAVYRILYGTRMAVEEAWLQAEEEEGDELLLAPAVTSATPAATVGGVEIHSGDLLVSRGGAPTSAFISRGNDFPGSFSHVALVHVGTDKTVRIIESLIETGVVVSSAEEYLEDGKLRMLVLRVDPTLPEVVADPQLPHRAASRALERARAIRIPYDFAMDFDDPERQFCSEVVSSAYAGEGLDLWWRKSTFSSPGLGRWMSGLGVRNLQTLSPSDLEHDPRLRLVAEWHDREALFSAHVDDAVIDALLARADEGLELEGAWWTIGPARLLVGVSTLARAMGGEGPIPDGMTAAAATRVDRLRAWHGAARARVLDEAARFEAERGYRPPYWRLVELAEAAVAQVTE